MKGERGGEQNILQSLPILHASGCMQRGSSCEELPWVKRGQGMGRRPSPRGSALHGHTELMPEGHLWVRGSGRSASGASVDRYAVSTGREGKGRRCWASGIAWDVVELATVRGLEKELERNKCPSKGPQCLTKRAHRKGVTATRHSSETDWTPLVQF